MSAFVCSKKHIGALARWLTNVCGNDHRSEWDEGFAYYFRTLMDENIRSVCTRYEDDNPEAYAYTVNEESWADAPLIEDAKQILGLALCYEYQACETEDWQTTPAYRLLLRILFTAAGRVPGVSDHWAI